MLTRICLAIAVSAVCTSFLTSAEPSVEELRANPKKYAGQSVVLDKVKLFGGVNRDKDGTSWVHIVSAAGKVDFAMGNGPRFSLSSNVADEIIKATGAGFKINTPILVACTVKADGDKYVFVITKMKFYNSKGTTVMKQFGD